MRYLHRWSAAVAALALAVGVAVTVGAAGGARASVTGTNLLTGVASSFDGSTGNWSCAGTCALADVASPVLAGSGALAITQTGLNGASEWVEAGTGASSWVPAAPGSVYTGGASALAVGVARTAAPFLVFYDASGSQLQAQFGPGAADGLTWVATPTVTAIAPAGTAYVNLGFVFGGALLGEIHLLDNAFVNGRSGTSAAVTGPLSTSGNRIFDGTGHPVVLRGVVRTATEISSANFPSDTEIAHAKAWGANFIRVPLGEQLWLNTCPGGAATNDPTYPTKVDQEVSSITGRGMVALLDLHFNVVAPCGTASQHTMADAANSVTFWTQVAKRYARNTLVAFDLYNEPHDISDTVWRNGGTVTEGTTTYRAEGMQTLYQTVRNQGARNLVFISGNAWANVPSTKPVSGFNIVNAAHVYTCPAVAPPGCATPNPMDPSPILNNWLTTSLVSPVMVTEFGWPSNSDGTYNRNVISYAEGHGWGWSVFAWDGGTGGAFDLLADNGATYQAAAAGQPVLAGLGANLLGPATGTGGTIPTVVPAPKPAPGTSPVRKWGGRVRPRHELPYVHWSF